MTEEMVLSVTKLFMDVELNNVSVAVQFSVVVGSGNQFFFVWKDPMDNHTPKQKPKIPPMLAPCSRLIRKTQCF